MEHETGAAGPYRPADVIGRDHGIGRSTSGRRRRVGAVAVGAVVLVGGGGAAALAASSAPSPGTPSPGTPGPGAPSLGASPAPSPSAGAERRAKGGPGRGWLGGGALHGRITVPGPGATYEEVLVQRGEVTAVSPTSLDVRSADGYAHTYRLDAGTVVDGRKGDSSSLAVGDTVRVLAGTDDTARRVHERKRTDAVLPGREGAPGERRGGGKRGPGATPAPSSPAPGSPAPSGPAPAPSSSAPAPGQTSGGDAQAPATGARSA